MKFKEVFSVLIELLIVISCTGCLIPLPHVKEICPAIEGRIVSDIDSKGIEGSHIKALYPNGKTKHTVTDKYGFFRFPAESSFYLGILWTPALSHSIPYDCCVYGYADLEIEAKEYKTTYVCPLSNSFREECDSSICKVYQSPGYEEKKQIFSEIRIRSLQGP